jgi:hypothetical protein
MRNHLISAMIGVVAIFALSASKPAVAFVASQNGVATAAAVATNVIEVKRSTAQGAAAGVEPRTKNRLARSLKAARSNLTENFVVAEYQR